MQWNHVTGKISAKTLRREQVVLHHVKFHLFIKITL